MSLVNSGSKYLMPCVERVRAFDRNDSSVSQPDYAVDDRRALDAVRCHHDRYPKIVRRFPQQVQHEFARPAVEVAGRLVSEK